MSRGSRTREQEYERSERRPRVSDAASLDSRVFIGGINSKQLTYRDVESWMSKYGRIIDISFFDRHILIQFDLEEDATRAVDREHGQTFRGSRFDIRFAHSSDGTLSRSNIPRSRSPRNLPYERDPRELSPRREPVRERSSDDRDRYYNDRRPISPDPRNYERTRIASDDRSRGVIDDRSRNVIEDRPRNALEERSRSNTRQEPLNNDIQDSNWNGPPIPNKAPVERPSFDAAIIAMSSELLNYAETIESKFQRQIALSTHIIVLKEEAHANACIEDLEKKGVLYAFLVNHVNEKHLSCTLRILHGTGQEHRNMLLTQALPFVARNFEDYQKQHKEAKSTVPKSNFDPSRMPPGFMAPDDKIIYQLHLLADSRMLTLDELNEVDDFIQRRITVLAQAEGRVEKPSALVGVSAKEMIKVNPGLRDDSVMIGAPGQLQSKMMNMTNMLDNNQYNELSVPSISNINNQLQNTKVQQALDTLIQSKFRVNNPSQDQQLLLQQQQGVIDDGSASATGVYPAMINQQGGVASQFISQQIAGRPMNPMNAAMRPMQATSAYVANYNTGFYSQQQQQQQQIQQQQLGQTMYRPRQQQFQANMPGHYPGY